MNQTEIIHLPFYVARDLGWLRTYQALAPLSQRAEDGEIISAQEKQDALAVAAVVAEQVLKGISNEEVADFQKNGKPTLFHENSALQQHNGKK